MAAAKANYLIIYKQSSQVYTATSLSTAVKTPVPKGCSIEDKMILFVSYLPDEENLNLYLLTEDQIKEEESNVKKGSKADSED